MKEFAGFCGEYHKIPNFPKKKCLTYKKKIGIQQFCFLKKSLF